MSQLIIVDVVSAVAIFKPSSVCDLVWLRGRSGVYVQMTGCAVRLVHKICLVMLIKMVLASQSPRPLLTTACHTHTHTHVQLNTPE